MTVLYQNEFSLRISAAFETNGGLIYGRHDKSPKTISLKGSAICIRPAEKSCSIQTGPWPVGRPDVIDVTSRTWPQKEGLRYAANRQSKAMLSFGQTRNPDERSYFRARESFEVALYIHTAGPRMGS